MFSEHLKVKTPSLSSELNTSVLVNPMSVKCKTPPHLEGRPVFTVSVCSTAAPPLRSSATPTSISLILFNFFGCNPRLILRSFLKKSLSMNKYLFDRQVKLKQLAHSKHLERQTHLSVPNLLSKLEQLLLTWVRADYFSSFLF